MEKQGIERESASDNQRHRDTIENMTINDKANNETIRAGDLAGLLASCDIGDRVRVNELAMPPVYTGLVGTVTGIIAVSGGDVYQVDIPIDGRSTPVKLLLSIAEFDKVIEPPSRKPVNRWHSGFE